MGMGVPVQPSAVAPTSSGSEASERYGSLKLVRPEIVAALRRSVEREGVLQAITVNARPGGKAILLDGFKRVMVLRELGRGEVQAKVVELSEEAALAAVIGCNRPHRGLTELEEAWVVRSLVRGCKLQQTDVAVLVGRHKSWVSRRRMLSERLDEDVAADLRQLSGARRPRPLSFF
jgi:ParB-like chromosome segregation protein Spo0J